MKFHDNRQGQNVFPTYTDHEVRDDIYSSCEYKNSVRSPACRCLKPHRVAMKKMALLKYMARNGKNLDVKSSEFSKNALRYSCKVGAIAAKEEDEPAIVDKINSGNYVAVFDPLDGSSSIVAGIATGTIFRIFIWNLGFVISD